MAQSNSNKPPQAIIPYGPVVRVRSAQNGNRREPMVEEMQGKKGNKNKDVIVAELFITKRLEWDCNYCTMFYDGNAFFKRLPNNSDSVSLTEKEITNFKFAIAAAAKKNREVLAFIERFPHKEFHEIGY
jgi:hypothetical protein